MRGRPTIDRKGKRINLRINDTTYKKLYTIAENCGITVAEYVRSMIDGENQKPGNAGVPQIDKGVPQEFLQMLHDLRMPLSDFITEITNLIDSGCLMNENGHLVSKEQGIDLSGFIEICHETGADPQKMINESINGMIKGR